MRLILKLTSAVAIAVVIQCMINGTAAELLDEARFTLQVQARLAGGGEVFDPELLDAASAMWQRRVSRHMPFGATGAGAHPAPAARSPWQDLGRHVAMEAAAEAAGAEAVTDACDSFEVAATGAPAAATGEHGWR